MNRTELKSLCTSLTMRQIKSFCEKFDIDLRHSKALGNLYLVGKQFTHMQAYIDDNPVGVKIVARLNARKLLNGEQYSYYLYVDENLNQYVHTEAVTDEVRSIRDLIYVPVASSEYCFRKTLISLQDYAAARYDEYIKGYYFGEPYEIDGLKVSSYTYREYTIEAFDDWNQRSRHLLDNATCVCVSEEYSWNTVWVYNPYLLAHPEYYGQDTLNQRWYLREVLAEVDGQLLCKDNWKNKYFRCSECGELHLLEEKIVIGGQVICQNCFSQIENSENFVKCDHCGNYFYKNETYVGIGGKRYCNSCVRHSVLSYHGVDRNRFYRPLALENETTDLYFGTEVETQGPQVNACLVAYENEDLFHCEHDGSIGEGFEIISQPMSLNFIKANFTRIKEMFEKLTAAGQKSHDTSCCGYHIHASRKAFKDEDAICRAVAIVNYFKENCEVIARRKNGHYYSYSTIPGIITKKKVKNCDTYGHGVSVNTSNPNTIEFRIFRGTLNPNTYMATLEFVDNIIKFANSGKMRFKFSELLKGEYLPAYIETRLSRNRIDFDKVIDFAGYNQEEVKLNLKKRWDLINAIKAYNADPSNINKIKPEQLGFVRKPVAPAVGGAC